MHIQGDKCIYVVMGQSMQVKLVYLVFYLLHALTCSVPIFIICFTCSMPLFFTCLARHMFYLLHAYTCLCFYLINVFTRTCLCLFYALFSYAMLGIVRLFDCCVLVTLFGSLLRYMSKINSKTWDLTLLFVRAHSFLSKLCLFILFDSYYGYFFIWMC